jgi:hypothetical protein
MLRMLLYGNRHHLKFDVNAVGVITLASILGAMPIKKPTNSRILTALQEAAKKQKTNPYQIAKASGMPLTTVQRLLNKKINTPLRNVEMLLAALGTDYRIVADRRPIARPGTGRRRWQGRGHR